MFYLQHVIFQSCYKGDQSPSLSTGMGQVIPSPVKLAPEALG